MPNQQYGSLPKIELELNKGSLPKSSETDDSGGPNYIQNEIHNHEMD